MKKLNKKSRLNHIEGLDVVIAIILSAFAFTILYPFYNSFLISIVPQSEYLQKPFMLYPAKLDFTAYAYVFKDSLIPSGFRTTILVTVFGTLYSMFFTISMAYALTKKFPGRKIMYLFLLIPCWLPGGMIPDYLLIKKLGLIDSILALILPGGLVWGTTLVMSRFLNNIPFELEEAAKLDGANEWIICWRIILPLSLPIIATYSLYTAVDKWNEWFAGMLYIRTAAKMPLQTILRNIIQESQGGILTNEDAKKTLVYTESVKMACLIVTMGPIMCIYPFLQKYFTEGLMMGAVKS